MAEDKKNTVVYTLEICFNPDTDEIEYIAEGMDDEDIDITPLSPYNLSSDVTTMFTWEDMELIRKIYNIEKD